jgi:thiamine biosynthesis protein ThiS
MRLFYCPPPAFKPLRLIINGQEREINTVKTLAELVRELDISVPHFAAAVNSQVIPKSRYESTEIRDGDKVEIVHAVGGG